MTTHQEPSKVKVNTKASHNIVLRNINQEDTETAITIATRSPGDEQNERMLHIEQYCHAKK